MPNVTIGMQGTNPEVLFQMQSFIPLYTSHVFVQNVLTPNIARKACHSEEACDRSIQVFKKVKLLYGCLTSLEISQTIMISERLVNECIALIERKKIFHG